MRVKIIKKCSKKYIYTSKDWKTNFLHFSQSAFSIQLGLIWPLPFDFALCRVPRVFLFLGSFKFFLFAIFLVFIYDSMSMKALLAVSRDLSTDKQNRGHRSLRNSTWSDKSHRKKNLDQNCGNGRGIAILTLCQFPDLPIGLYENQYHGSPSFCSILS